MDKRDGLSADFVRKILKYDPATGIFTWREDIEKRPQWNGRYAGKIAGIVVKSGYVLIGVNGSLYRAHRLAWIYMTGAWPKEDIDHVNLNRSDNRICNLREATRSQNHANKRVSMNNKAKAKGVFWREDRGKWAAQIKINGKSKHLGHFSNLEDASSAYGAAAKLHFGEFARVH